LNHQGAAKFEEADDGDVLLELKEDQFVSKRFEDVQTRLACDCLVQEASDAKSESRVYYKRCYNIPLRERSLIRLPSP
jgi:hypothetical protein